MASEQRIFDWQLPDKYLIFFNFEIKVKIIFLTTTWIIEENEKVPINMSWLGSEELRFMPSLNDTENADQVRSCLKYLMKSSGHKVMRQYGYCNIKNWWGNRMKIQKNIWVN